MEETNTLHKRHWTRRIAVGALAVVLTLVAVIAVLLAIVTSEGFVNKQLGGKLGRPVAVQGPIHVDWSWHAPRFTINQLTIGNDPAFPDDPQMLALQRLDVQIKIWPLLVGRVELPELTLTGPRLVLEKNQTVKNWQFPALSGANAVKTAALPQSRHGFPVIDKLVLSDGVLVYRDHTSDLYIELKLESVNGEGGDENARMIVSGTGTMQGQTFKLDATGGSIEALRGNSRPYPLKLDLAMGATKIAVDGTFSDPVALKGADAQMNVSGADMADLFYLTQIPLPPTPPYDIKGRLKKDGEIWSYNDFAGKVGGSDLGGNLAYDTSGPRGHVQADLVSHRMDAKDLGGFIGLAPKSDEAAAQKKSARLIPDVPLNLSRLRATDMDVSLRIDKLDAPSVPIKGMTATFDLERGLLTVDPMNLTLADGTVGGKLTLDGRTDVPNVDTDITLKNLHLGRFFDGTRFAATTKGNMGGRIAIKGSGASLAKVLADSDGRIQFIVSSGTLSLLLVEAADLDIAEAAPLFAGKDKSTTIRCGVGDFKVTNGVLRSEAFVLDTTDTNLEGQVDIDLARERLYAQLDAHPKDGSLLAIQAPIIVSGRMKKPSIGIDMSETGARAGASGILGVLLTPLAAIIPFIETGDDGKDANCRALFARVGAQ